MNARFAPPALGAVVLRVLTGRLSGAEHRLPPGKFVRLGHGFDHDIVLRDASTRGASVELHFDEGVARLKVVAGTVTLLGQPVAPGAQVTVPPYVPIAIGGFAVAIGEPASDRWTEAARLSTMLASQPADADGPSRAAIAERMATRLSPVRSAIAIERRWPLYAAAAALLLLVAAIATPAIQWIAGGGADPAAAQAVLAAGGFPDLGIATGPAGPVVRGIVRDDAALSRLRALVAERIPGATVDVDTMDGLAAAATDLLRAQGVDGEAVPRRGHALLVNAEFLPADRQAELARLIRQDVPGIARVYFAADSRRGDRDLQYFFSGSEYGLATFVDGDPGYIATADGTRWFPGAQVPTGHRILSIANGRARFERDGQVEELVLGASAPPAQASTSPSGGNTSEGSQS